ncbi:hypothetical protein MXB_5280, partial [Myxobolus squamalis]
QLKFQLLLLSKPGLLSIMPNLKNSTELFTNSDSCLSHSTCYFSNDALSNLTNDDLNFFLKSTQKSIGDCQEYMKQILEDKRLILSELVTRITCNKTNLEKDIHCVGKLISSANELLNSFLESHQSDNSLLINIVDNSNERVNSMEIYKEFIRKNHLNTIGHDSFGVIQAGIEENKRLINQMSDMMINQRSCSKRNSFIGVELNTARDERDETREDNKILRHSLYHQTKVIAELNYENKELKNRIKNNSISENNSPSLSTSLSIQIEPLRRACANYNHELRKSVRSLELLIVSAKSPTCNGDVINEPTFLFESEMSNTIELCLNSINLLQTVLHDNPPVSQKINLKSCISNIETIQAKIQHILAQIYCDESL